MHPVGQILNYDFRREFQGSGIEHLHVPIHVADSPKIDENTGGEAAQFVDRHITYSLPDVESNSELYNLVKPAQTCNHMSQVTRYVTCHKKKDITCEFCVPWPVTKKQ